MSTPRTWLQAEEEINDLRTVIAGLVGTLDWINRKGGLGLDVHDRITAALAQANAALAASESVTNDSN